MHQKHIGMLPFENLVANYVRETGNHVMYRVTPIYEGNNLLSNGVQMEGYSVKDTGKGVSFHVFIYNVHPGIWIDYATGAGELEEEYGNQTTQEPEGKGEVRYILNTNTLKIHLPICSSIDDMKEHNKKKFKGTLEEAEKEGYTACKRCNPR